MVNSFGGVGVAKAVSNDRAEIRKAWCGGASAFVAGVEVFRNPYPFGSEKALWWERAVEANARAVQARPVSRQLRWPRIAQLTLTNLRSLAVPRPSFTSRLEPDCRTVAC